jgi:folate-binding protein YgfZ
MTFPSPIQELLEHYALDFDNENKQVTREGAATGTFQPKVLTEFLPWGDDGCFVLATTGIVELEYAAIQKTTGLFDAPCRGTVELIGEDRLEFVGRLTTQKVSEMKAGDVKVAFVTSRKGTIVADVVIRVFEERILLDVDVTTVEQLITHLNSYIVMEDVSVKNLTSSVHWFWCVGPKANNLKCDLAEIHKLPRALLGLIGVAIMVSTDQVREVWESLIGYGCKPIGWFALNMARVEQGAPLFMIDFDTSNLPHETNLLRSRVSFDKGCYLGQEVIARMESLGQPKQKIMRLVMQSDSLPIAGTQLWKDTSASGTPTGIVTSSSISPLAGSIPVAIGMLSKKCDEVGSSMYLYVGTDILEAKVEEL